MLLENIHRFFFFLTTNEGTLLKYFLELTILSTILYMIISEYIRSREQEMKFLAIGFGLLVFEKFTVTFFLWYHVFGNIPIYIANSRLPLVDNCLEILALILFSNAFLYPLFRNRKKIFYSKILVELFVYLVTLMSVAITWSIILSTTSNIVNFNLFKGNLLFFGLKLYLLILPIIYILHAKKKMRYANGIMFGFLLYSIAPMISLINVVFFRGGQFQLYGIVHPFPLLAVLLFTRVVYLKLADKLTLQERLKVSEKRFLEAKEINKLKDEFVSVVSHELKTPLTSIKLYLSLLRKGELGSVNDDQAKAISILQEESDRLTNMVNDVLDLSKLEAKKSEIFKENVNIIDMLTENPHYKLAEKKGIRIIKHLPQEMTVTVDLAKFRQIFLNLLSNAVKHTSEGGWIRISLAKKEKTWTFTVEDNGEGIQKEQIPLLFKRFYQAGDHMTRKHSGTGLGLSIVKELVNLHDGRISVDSEPGKGTRFIIEFPL